MAEAGSLWAAAGRGAVSAALPCRVVTSVLTTCFLLLAMFRTFALSPARIGRRGAERDVGASRRRIVPNLGDNGHALDGPSTPPVPTCNVAGANLQRRRRGCRKTEGVSGVVFYPELLSPVGRCPRRSSRRSA